jgi:hypothetical protein
MTTKKASKKNAASKKTAAKSARRTVSSVARELILAGRTNEQVFDALHKEFKLAADHRAYPSWYRAQIVRAEKKARGAKAAEALHARLSKTAHAA